jgi:MFS family permease
MDDFQSGVDLANSGNVTGLARVFRGFGLIAFCVVGLVLLAKFSPFSTESLVAVSVPALIVFIGPGLMMILAGLVEAVSGTRWSSLHPVTRGFLLVIGIPLVCAALFFGVGLTVNYIQDHFSDLPNPKGE